MLMAGIISNIFTGFKEVFLAFVKDPSIWWLIAPIILFWAIIEIYLDIYKKEELGWNTALGNGLSVFWVCIICLKFLFETGLKNFRWSKLIAVILIFLYGLLIITNSFYHRLKKNISFILAAPTPVYFLSLVIILWTYGLLPITIWIILDLVILFVIISAVEIILKKIIKEKIAAE
jgi:hypothetical protein